MSLPKILARSVVFPVINALGADRLIGLRHRQQNMILCFHGVTAQPDFSINNRHMPVEQFDKLIGYLAKHYDIVGTETFFNTERSTGKGRRRLCLTFDDGYLDNLTTALPVLEKHRVPATFFVLSKGLDDPDFMIWTDLFDLLMRHSDRNELTVGGLHFHRRGKGFFCAEKNGMSIVEYLKTTADEKYRFLEQLASESDQIDRIRAEFPDYWKLMNREALKTFAQSPYVTIGSHTHTHHNLANIDRELAKEELARSKNELEAALDRPVRCIAYPDGSYDAPVKDLAEEAGYIEQLAVNYRVAGDPDDKRILPRLSISNSTTWQSVAFQINTGFGKIGF